MVAELKRNARAVEGLQHPLGLDVGKICPVRDAQLQLSVVVFKSIGEGHAIL